MKNNSLKQKLNANELTIGSWVTFSSPKVIEVLSGFGFDWLCIDIEHNLLNNETLINLIRTIQYYDMAALVRIDDNEPVIIKKCLDAGADGLIIPMMNNKEDAESALNSAYYPPKGRRGVGLSRAQKYGLSFDQYQAWLENNLVIIAQIEHYEGMKNLELIIDTPGIDGAIIGPYDLSASLGYPGKFERDDVKVLLERFKEVCIKTKLPFGEHIVYPEPDKLDTKIAEGSKFIAYGTDFNFMIKGLADNYSRGAK